MKDKKTTNFIECSSQKASFQLRNKLFLFCISPVNVFLCLTCFMYLDNNEKKSKNL